MDDFDYPMTDGRIRATDPHWRPAWPPKKRRRRGRALVTLLAILALAAFLLYLGSR
jgi:hypothetical protein